MLLIVVLLAMLCAVTVGQSQGNGHGKGKGKGKGLGSDGFVFTVEVTAGDLTFAMPLPVTAVLSVNWGDGTTNTATSHTYTDQGIYTVTVSGVVEGWSFANSGDRLKMREILQWGGFTLTGSRAFDGCASLTISPSIPDAPTLSATGMLDLSYMFRNCTELTTGNFGEWELQNAAIGGMNLVNDFTGMFQGCTDFAGDLSDWSISEATDMSEFLEGTVLTMELYDSLLFRWGNQVRQNTITLHAGGAMASVGPVDPMSSDVQLQTDITRECLCDKMVEAGTWIITDGTHQPWNGTLCGFV